MMDKRWYFPDGKEAVCSGDPAGHDLQVLEDLETAVCPRCGERFWFASGFLLRAPDDR